MRRRALLISVAAIAGLLGVALALAGKPKAETPPTARVPAHPALVDRADPSVRAGLEIVERLRRIRASRPVAMGGAGDPEFDEALLELRRTSAPLLHYLEEIALRSAEPAALRVDLLNIVALHPGEETRRFLCTLVADGAETPEVRIAALEPLMRYRDAATFDVLRAAWLDERPFDGRYLICRALGENGRPGALPILRGALGRNQPPAVRAHAALALGAFADDPSVLEELRRLALSDDPLPAVRQNAMRALLRSPADSVEATLSAVASSPESDAETRRLARQLLAGRRKGP